MYSEMYVLVGTFSKKRVYFLSLRYTLYLSTCTFCLILLTYSLKCVAQRILETVWKKGIYSFFSRLCTHAAMMQT